jgi:septum formation protein
VILASASAARHRVLAGAGVPHVCDPAGVDEKAILDEMRKSGADAPAAALALARAKAAAVAKRHPGALVIGADQILASDGRWFEKPKHRDDAFATLQALRGRTHQLVTAVAVNRDGRHAWENVAVARLTMRKFSDEFVARYLEAAGPQALESVGGYRLEAEGAQLFTAVEGDYFSILGLPLLPLLGYLREARVLER